MKFKTKKIATAVAASLGLSVVGMSAAKADSILFPHFVLSPTVTTVLSVINDNFTAAGASNLHYRYYYKDVGAAGAATAPCKEYDFWNPTSTNDIVTFDMGANPGFNSDAKGVLFEPNSTNARYVDDFAVLGRTTPVPPTRGFVVVENRGFNPTDIPVPTAKLAGEAIVIEFVSGSAWGYQAYNAADMWGFVDPNLILLNANDFSDRVEVNGEVLTTPIRNTPPEEQKASYWAATSIMPWDIMTSALLVTAASVNMGPDGSYAQTTSLKLRGTAQGADRIMFNRDERAYSGPGGADITCVGRVDMRDMVGETVRQSTPQGGWTNVSVTKGEAIVFKAEINTGTFPVADGTFNNVYLMRKGFRESQRGLVMRTAAGGAGNFFLVDAAGSVDDNRCGRPVAQPGVAPVGTPSNCYLPTYAIPSLREMNAPFPPLVGVTSAPVLRFGDAVGSNLTYPIPGKDLTAPLVGEGRTFINPNVYIAAGTTAGVRPLNAKLQGAATYTAAPADAVAQAVASAEAGKGGVIIGTPDSWTQ